MAVAISGGVLIVAFTDSSSTPIPEPLRGPYQRVVENALDLLRPAGEHWAVTIAETTTTVLLDFTRDTDAPRSITFASDGDDDRHSQVLRSVCGLPRSDTRRRLMDGCNVLAVSPLNRRGKEPATVLTNRARRALKQILVFPIGN